MNEEQAPKEWEPDVAFRLRSELYDYQQEAEERWASPTTPEETALHHALDRLEDHALSILTTGTVPQALTDQLDSFEPGSALPEKIGSLLRYDIALERLEFAVGHDVVDRLDGVKDRLQLALFAFLLLLRARPSGTAIKYFERAAKLYLAGYTTETVVMCGAVLEAAMTARFPDELLRGAGWRPAYKRTGVFSLGQRMQYEDDHPIFDSNQREIFWKIVNWRNDAVHVQPDIAPDPKRPLIFAAHLLSLILPGDTS